MRILASNPDTIGDVVLRQPLYDAILKAGHELILIVRPLLAPVMASIAPGARILTCGVNLYNPRLKLESPELQPIVDEVLQEKPDLFLVGPYQWTVLEERLAAFMPGVPCIAMSGKRFADVHYGPAPACMLSPTTRVEVAEDIAETRKNELLAAAVLGRVVRLPDPEVTPAPEHLWTAEAELAKLGLEPGGYWVACIGEGEHTAIRNWRKERWSQALAAWAAKYGKRFLVIGHQSEQAAAREIVQGMGDRSGHAVFWSGDGDGDLDVLLGLIGHSAGYVGRDTGPMHLAAAMGKPVLAVFGGGTWPRFLPQVDRSIAVAVGVPCVGCGWVCHLPESYCIKEVPLEAVLGAIDDLESGRPIGREARLLKPDSAQLASIGREGAASARQRMVELSVSRREHMEQSESLSAVLERALKQAGRAEAMHEELEALRAESVRRESVLKQRLAAAENAFRAREADLTKRLADYEASGSPVAARRESELIEKLAQVQAELARTQAELLQAKSEAADAQIRITRYDKDQNALANLSRQQESEVVVLRGRLNDLMASRWRRYGQRLHLCMTMPWEREYSNGHAH